MTNRSKMKNVAALAMTAALAGCAAVLAGCAARSAAPADPGDAAEKRAAELALADTAERLAASERLYLAGDLAEAEAIVRPALGRARADADRAALLVQLGRVRTRMVWFWDARADLAAGPLEEGLALAERSGDPDRLSDALDATAMLIYAEKLFHDRGEWAPIERRFARALALARDDSRRARTRFHIGLTHQMQGRLEPARREFEASLALARAARDDETAAQDLRHLAYLASVAGDRARALALHGQALELQLRCGNQPGAATARLAIAQLHLEAGEDDAARRQLEPAYQIARRLALGYPQIEAAVALAGIQVRAGRAAAARPLAERAVLLARSRRDDEGAARALLAAAQVSAALGQPDRARAELAEARAAAGRNPELMRACDEAAGRLGLASR
jgi:tetratricopeptide (TPR) repeat protein